MTDINKLIIEIENDSKKLIYLQEDNKLVNLIIRGRILGKEAVALAQDIIKSIVSRRPNALRKNNHKSI
jgi:hypothetical protein